MNQIFCIFWELSSHHAYTKGHWLAAPVAVANKNKQENTSGSNCPLISSRRSLFYPCLVVLNSLVYNMHMHQNQKHKHSKA